METEPNDPQQRASQPAKAPARRKSTGKTRAMSGKRGGAEVTAQRAIQNSYDDAILAMLLQKHRTALTRTWVIAVAARAVLVVGILAGAALGLSYSRSLTTTTGYSSGDTALLPFLLITSIPLLSLCFFWRIDLGRSERQLNSIEDSIVRRAQGVPRDDFIRANIYSGKGYSPASAFEPLIWAALALTPTFFFIVALELLQRAALER